MSFLVPLACMALLAAFLGAIAYPVLTTRHAWRRATGTDRARLELTEHKEQLYASIKELEFDHSLGKVATEDYESLRVGLESEAVEVLRRLDALDGHADASASAALDARIEADIAAQRGGPAPARTPAPAPAAASAPTPAAAGAPHAFCFKCGQPRTPEYRFCPHCGQAFPDAATN